MLENEIRLAKNIIDLLYENKDFQGLSELGAYANGKYRNLCRDNPMPSPIKLGRTNNA